jgi:hypothetical protein
MGSDTSEQHEPTFWKEQHMRSLASRRTRSVMTRGAVMVTLGLMAVLAGPVAAQAAAPDHEDFDFTGTFVDDEVCAAEGFAVTVTETDRDDVYRYFNADGSFKQTIVHLRHDYIISANGHTIHQSGQWQVYYTPDGSRSVGLSDHIAGADGFVDAGQIVFNADGSVSSIHGSHLHLGEPFFCSALMP